MKERGLTLVELTIVISIVGILVVAMGFTYQGWQGRYKVESAVKTLYADLMDARTRATGMRATYLVDFPTATSYRIANDTDGNGAIEAVEVLPTFPKNIAYTINGGVLITFDDKGLIYSPTGLINASAPVTLSLIHDSTVNPDYDCVNLYPTKIVMGQLTGVVCNDK